jgi:MYXO-CTERM domain-containing protein
MPFRLAHLATLATLLLAGSARAQSLVAGPGDPGFDASLLAKIDGLERQVHGLLTVEIGWQLEAFVSDPEHRRRIDDFIVSGAHDFQAQTGLHPYQVVDRFDEYGDLGMFGGVQVAGTALRYAVLRDSGAPAAETERARAALIRAMRGLHWYHQITGVPGVVARGIRRNRPEPGEPPLPEPPPPTVPLDAPGADDKSPLWRADNSGELPFLIWLDDSSKDQLDGWVFALGLAVEVASGDPALAAELTTDLVEDARALGHALMRKLPVGNGEADLVMMDADGRPTSFHDLSAEEIAPGVVLSTPTNGFNAWMALGILRTLYQVTGDETIGRFYYEELIERRGYLDVAEDSLALMYLGNQTNYSNVNMAFVAAFGLLRYEPDPEIADQARRILEQRLYAPGVPRQAKGLGQSLFDFLYAGFGRLGVIGPGSQARSEGLSTLNEHPAAPYWTFGIENCDAAEQAALACSGVDGTPIELSPEPGRGGGLVAVHPLPMRLRPPSNFEWRSDPHRVNGGEGTRLNPGGEIAAAYWLGRFLSATSNGMENLSPRARPRPPAVAPDGGAAAESGDESGCGCRAGGAPGSGWAAPMLAWALLMMRRRRDARPGAASESGPAGSPVP